MQAPHEDDGIRWRVTFVDAVSASRIDVEVCAPDNVGPRAPEGGR